MTADEFGEMIERVAPGVQRKPVLETTQFRVGHKTFATLGWPSEGWAVVKLSLAEQRRVLAASDAFAREPGRRRNSGVTLVRLQGLDPELLADVLAVAWREAYAIPTSPRRRPGGRADVIAA
ncbi:MmcQ/YjbR family DNA-binding protein [Caulobacter sp. UNC279MFTsu5.1]|uniref:MmcQ/YjbR family DNA-binding protein n=1 Tax=Caulobacter sp. UNC279MFTsu5.1 TaxID=1502775 RepID=UPI0008EBC5A7|nr:MmcQ/YjbR family DNA-binding protein [Caulobacter sp. UNC279MFTsu5.1]SFI51539.1 YjbR protein [Caulobacter sp. UNC279MFTsu5.1]